MRRLYSAALLASILFLCVLSYARWRAAGGAQSVRQAAQTVGDMANSQEATERLNDAEGRDMANSQEATERLNDLDSWDMALEAAGDVAERGIFTYYYEDGSSRSVQENGRVIVVDAGHGGFDPGKVGVLGTLEKDLNLQLAFVLARRLQESGYRVYLTRYEDNGLYAPASASKKREDMRNRVGRITELAPDVTISLHQNSYPDETVSGLQVFFRKGDSGGKKLAELIHAQVLLACPEMKKRPVKENDSYYLLTHTEGTVLIVECGFLSNPDEEKLLNTVSYQELLAKSITEAVGAYLEAAGMVGSGCFE